MRRGAVQGSGRAHAAFDDAGDQAARLPDNHRRCCREELFLARGEPGDDKDSVVKSPMTHRTQVCIDYARCPPRLSLCGGPLKPFTVARRKPALPESLRYPLRRRKGMATVLVHGNHAKVREFRAAKDPSSVAQNVGFLRGNLNYVVNVSVNATVC